MKLNGGHSEALIGSVPGYTVEEIGKIPPIEQVQELLAAYLPDGEHQYQDFVHFLATIPYSTEVDEQHIIQCLALLEDARNHREEVFRFISGVVTSVYNEARNLLSAGIYLAYYENDAAVYAANYLPAINGLLAVLDLLEQSYSEEFLNRVERTIKGIEDGSVVDNGAKPSGVASMPQLTHLMLSEEASWQSLIAEQRQYYQGIEDTLVQGQPLSVSDIDEGKKTVQRISEVLSKRPQERIAELFKRAQQIWLGAQEGQSSGWIGGDEAGED